MKVAVFGNYINQDFFPELQKFFNFFNQKNIGVQIYEPFCSYLINELHFSPYYSGFFNSHIDFDNTNNLILSDSLI